MRCASFLVCAVHVVHHPHRQNQIQNQNQNQSLRETDVTVACSGEQARLRKEGRRLSPTRVHGAPARKVHAPSIMSTNQLAVGCLMCSSMILIAHVIGTERKAAAKSGLGQRRHLYDTCRATARACLQLTTHLQEYRNT